MYASAAKKMHLVSLWPWLWPLTLKSFPALPTHATNTNAEFRWTPSTRYGVSRHGKWVIPDNGRSDGRPDNIMPLTSGQGTTTAGAVPTHWAAGRINSLNKLFSHQNYEFHDRSSMATVLSAPALTRHLSSSSSSSFRYISGWALTVHRCLRHPAPCGTSPNTVCQSPKFLVASVCDHLPDVINCHFREFAAALIRCQWAADLH